MNLEGPNVSEFLMWSQNQPCVIVEHQRGWQHRDEIERSESDW